MILSIFNQDFPEEIVPLEHHIGLLPVNSVIAGVDWLNVQLESTLKLHRSLELISGGNAQLLSDMALDAIMASLGEIAESQVQPNGGNHRIEIPKFAYPTIAILTAAVIAATRKRRHSDPLVVGEMPSDEFL